MALTGLTVPEFQSLLPAFSRAYERLYPPDQTVEGRPRQRTAGGGRKGLLHRPEEKLLFILVYLKTYPLQVVMGDLVDLSQPQANHWIHRLLPVLRAALDDLGFRPERDPSHFAQSQPPGEPEPRLIIDCTERRRQRPKGPEKQALQYSGRKETHCDKNVVVADVPAKRIGFLSRTCAGKMSDKKIADEESISYPPGTVLYKDAGFQGYEPAVQETHPAKKKATPGDPHCLGETNEPEVRTHSGPSGACSRWCEALPHSQRCLSEYQGGRLGFGHGGGFGIAQPPSSES